MDFTEFILILSAEKQVNKLIFKILHKIDIDFLKIARGWLILQSNLFVFIQLLMKSFGLNTTEVHKIN
jgi:hypothetical protein